MNEQFIQELSEATGAALPDFRADVPPGTLLGEVEIEPGVQTKWFKPKSLMRAGKVVLPPRVALYDLLRHDISMVPPTIANKRMGDYPGRFTLRKPSDWHARDPVPIEEGCEVCGRRPEMENKPRFYSRSGLILHYRLVHTIEWEGIEADRRDKERREDAGMMRTLVASIAALARGGREMIKSGRPRKQAVAAAMRAAGKKRGK